MELFAKFRCIANDFHLHRGGGIKHPELSPEILAEDFAEPARHVIFETREINFQSRRRHAWRSLIAMAGKLIQLFPITGWKVLKEDDRRQRLAAIEIDCLPQGGDEP